MKNAKDFMDREMESCVLATVWQAMYCCPEVSYVHRSSGPVYVRQADLLGTRLANSTDWVHTRDSFPIR